jgi:oligopeptide transport system permease protein
LDMSLSYLGFEFVDGRTNTSIGWVLSTVLNNSEAAKGLYAVARYAYLLYIPMSISVILSISGYLMAKEFADIANPKNHR